MSYLVPRDKPKDCRECIFLDRISYDCKLMYAMDYKSFEEQYEHCPLIEVYEDDDE